MSVKRSLRNLIYESTHITLNYAVAVIAAIHYSISTGIVINFSIALNCTVHLQSGILRYCNERKAKKVIKKLLNIQSSRITTDELHDCLKNERLRRWFWKDYFEIRQFRVSFTAAGANFVPELMWHAEKLAFSD